MVHFQPSLIMAYECHLILNMNLNSYFAFCPVTFRVKRFQKNTKLPTGWIKGRPVMKK